MKLEGYTLKARLLPFILLITPVMALFTSQFFTPFSFLTTVPTFLIACTCVIVSIFVRNGGKKNEPALWNKWGGAPTTRFLRYNNTEYNKIDRERCHLYFKKNIPDIHFPTQQDELRNPSMADEVYDSCITSLRVKSRNRKKYPLVHSENVTYGFLRNSLGLRWPGIIVSASILIISLAFIIFYWIQHDLVEYSLIFPVIVSFIFFFIWALFITESQVKKAAENYARRLLEICLK